MIAIPVIILFCFASTGFVSCKETTGSSVSKNNLNPNPVVLELFSSEGCSSCPPAAAVMDAIIEKAEKENKPIYLLDYHVDYWDYLGWKDTLSKPEFTKRQSSYTTVFEQRSMYTPQVVINGIKETVGSDKGKVNDIINDELNQAPRTALTCYPMLDNEQHSIVIDYKLMGNTQNATINFAVTYNTVTDKILRGENRGKTLTHRNAVQALYEVPLINAEGSKTIEHLPSHCSILVFVQDKTTRKITAAWPILLK